MNYSPNSDQFALIHPFHMVMDDRMGLQQVGPAIVKLAPTLRLGAPFTDFFEIRRPRVSYTLEAIREMQQTVFLLQCVGNEITLKGQMLVDDSRRLIFFVGSIVMNENLELVKHGLTLSDFPIHDSGMDQAMFREQRLINKKLEDLVHERTVELEAEQAKSDSLLHAMLPAGIVERLKLGKTSIADKFTSASVLFADLVGFTPLTLELPAAEIIELLEELFSYFDSLLGMYGVEKIRTIGDNYMVASGVPVPRPNHAQALAHMALDMSDYIHSRPVYRDRRVDFRIGINSGPLIAGVIGDKKHQYDLWGDTVNTASRMESGGTPGKIQITRATYELIKDGFVCEPRGKVTVKGKGELETWYLVGAKSRD
jgi:class 3 adenylate cyclase